MARVLGLDTADGVLRGALLTTALRSSEVVAYAEVPIAPDEGADALGDAARMLLSTLPRPPDVIVAELDGRALSLRSVGLTGAAVKKIDEVLPFELEAVLPFPIEDAIVDHQAIDVGKTATRVLAAAVPRERVIARLQDLRLAGVEPRELAAGAVALDGLVPMVPALRTGGPHLLLHFGEEALDACVVTNGRAELGRTVSTGLAQLRRDGGARAESELRRTLAGFRAAGVVEPTCAHVSGLEPSPEALAWLERVLGIEARPVPLPLAPGGDPTNVHRFGRAVALAGRTALRGNRIDLRQGDLAMRRTMGAIRQHARLLAVCAGVIVATFVFSVYARYSVLEDEREALTARLGQTTKELFRVEMTDPSQVELLLTRGAAADDPLPRFDAFDALAAVSGGIPGETKHDARRVVVEIDDEAGDGKLEIQGTVDNLTARDRVVSALGEHACFRDIKVGPTSKSIDDRTNYRVDAVVGCEPATAATTAGKAP